MTDKLVFEADLDNTPILKAFERVRAEALSIDKLMSDLGKGTDLQQAMAQLATAATSSMQVVRQQLKTIDTSVKELQSQLSTSAKAAGKAIGDGVASGVQESTGKVTSVVRAQAQWLQAAYEDELKKGVKFSSKDLMDFKAWGVNIGADARAGIHEGMMRANSATPIDPRVLLGLTPDVMGKSAQASAEVFKDSFQASLQRARAASPIDPRTLLGLTPDVMGKSAQASAEVFKESFQAAALTASQRTKSASTIDPRVLLGLTPDVMTKSAKSSAEVFKESFQTELMRVKASSAPDPRVLLGLTPDVMTKSAKASADVFKEAGLLDKATKDLTKSQSDLNDAFRSGHSAARGLASGMNAMWLTWGQLGPLLAGAALSNAFVQAIRLGSEFENTLAIIEHVGGQATGEVRLLGEAALELSRVGPYGPNEVALALKTMALAGMDAKESMSALKPMLDFALVGEMGVEKATESAIAISKAFGYTAEGVSSVTDVIAKAAAVSMSSISSMTEAFRQASTVAQQFGVSLKDASTTLALLSQVGIQGTAAGTAMRNMYTELLGMSKGARDILKNVLQIEVFDNAAKAMKPLPIILRDLSAALKGKDFESQLRVLQRLGNERGLKALSADLVAFVTAAKGSGKDVVTVFEQIRRELDDSAGFVALAAVNISLTTSNQLKAVGAALQTTLVEAFLSVNTEVQRTAGALKDAFNSKEFKDGVAGLVGSLAALVRFLLEHKDVLAAVGIGVVGGVAATAGYAMFGSLAAGIGAVAAAVGVAAPALTLVMASLGPIGAVLGVATAAYVLFGRTAKTESERAAEAAGTQYSATMDGIKAEQERLDKAIAATKAQLLGTDAVLKAEQENAIERTRILHNEQMEVERTRHQHVMLNAQRTLGKIQGTEFENTAQGSAAVRQANEQIAASAAHVNETWKKQEKQMGALVAGLANIRRGATELATLQEQLAKKNANKPTGSGVYDPDSASKHATAMKTFRSNELAQTEKFYASELSLLDKYSANAQARLKDALSSGLIDKGEYMARELLMTEGFEKQKLQLLDKERAAYEAAYTNGVQKYLQDYDDWVNKHKGEKGFAEQQAKAFETLQQSLVNTSLAAETFFEKNDAEKAKVQDNALTRMYKQAVDLQGAIKKLETDTREFWAAEEVLTKKASTQTATEDALRYASPETAAYISAAAKETERLTDRVYDYDKKIRLATISMDAFVASVGDDANWTKSLTSSYLGQKEALAALNAERSKLLSVIPDRAAEKGKLAVTKYWKDWEGDLVKGLSGSVMVALFEGGKAGSKSLRALIIAELRKPIQIVVQALVQPIASGVSNLFGLNSSGGAGGLISLLGGTGTVGSTIAGWLGLGGATAAGVAANVGIGTAAGLTAAEATAAATAAGAAAEGGLMASLDPLLSAAPYLAAIAGVYMLAQRLDHSGTPHSGAGTSYSAASGLAQASAGATGGGLFAGISYSSDTEKMTTGLVQSIVGILDSTAVTFGKSAGYEAAASFADDSSKDGAWGSLVISKLGEVVSGWAVWAGHGQVFSDGAAGSAEYLAKVTSDVRAALDGIGLPAWATSMLDKLGESPTLETLSATVAEITKIQTVLVRLGAALPMVSNLGGDAVQQLVKASGGVDSLATKAASYYDAYFTAEERKAHTFDQIRSALAAVNITLPETSTLTRDWLRAQVQAASKLGDSGVMTVAALLNVADAFASVVPATEEASTAVKRTAADIATSMASLTKDSKNLEIELMMAQGNASGARSAQRALDTAGMVNPDGSINTAEVALYDFNQTLRDSITLLNDAKSSYQTYYDTFATDEQKRAKAVASVTEALGPGITTTAQYRAEVDRLVAEYGIGSAEVKKATDVAGEFSTAFPAVSSAVASLTKDVSAFREGFFTAAEQVQMSSTDMTEALKALGLSTLPTSNAEFRALALSVDTSTDSGKELYNGLMGLAGAFARLHPLVSTAEEVINSFDGALASLRASGASRTVEQIASNFLTLEEQLFQAQNVGNTPALRQHILDKLSDVKDSITGLSERDLQNLIWGIEDTRSAAEKAAADMKTAADDATRAMDAMAAEAKRIADEHAGLWRQYLEATGNIAAIRELELATLDPSNRELQKMIWALQDQKDATDKAAAAAEELKSTWTSLTDSIMEEVKRIRGIITESSGGSYASLAAQFAIATAQTRARDQDAAKLLPGLAQSMLTAYESTATSLVDLQRQRALTANSLEQTASLVSGGASTADPVTEALAGRGRGTALSVNAGTTYAVTPAAPAYGLSDMVVELRKEIAALKEEVKGLRAEALASGSTIASNTGGSLRLHKQWNDVGLPITTETDLAAVYGA